MEDCSVNGSKHVETTVQSETVDQVRTRVLTEKFYNILSHVYEARRKFIVENYVSYMAERELARLNAFRMNTLITARKFLKLLDEDNRKGLNKGKSDVLLFSGLMSILKGGKLNGKAN